MAKALLFGTVLALAIGTTAMAQSDTPPPPSQDTDARAGAGVRSGNITSTGETVPNPGASQGAGVTPLDKGIQREDNRITSGICKGC
jgi:hypothetical protein